MSPELKAKLWSVLKGAGVAAVGAALYYVAAYLATPEAQVDFGPALAGLLMVAVNAFRKFVLPAGAVKVVAPENDPLPPANEAAMPVDDDRNDEFPSFPFRDVG